MTTSRRRTAWRGTRWWLCRRWHGGTMLGSLAHDGGRYLRCSGTHATTTRWWAGGDTVTAAWQCYCATVSGCCCKRSAVPTECGTPKTMQAGLEFADLFFWPRASKPKGQSRTIINHVLLTCLRTFQSVATLLICKFRLCWNLNLFHCLCFSQLIILAQRVAY